MSYAKAMDAVNITASATKDGICVLETPCYNYDDFVLLPKAIDAPLFGKRYFGKTGWSSDYNVAYYRDDATIAQGALYITLYDLAVIIKAAANDVRALRTLELRGGARHSLTRIRASIINYFRNNPEFDVDKFLLNSQ